jgi:hypothetical protein
MDLLHVLPKLPTPPCAQSPTFTFKIGLRLKVDFQVHLVYYWIIIIFW